MLQTCNSGVSIFTLKAAYIYQCLWCCSVSKSCLILCNPMNCSTPGFPGLHYLPEFAQTHIHWVGVTIQPSQPLSPPSPLALNLFQWIRIFSIRIFSNESGLGIRCPKYCSCSFICPSNEYSRLISFRIDWFDLLSVQGTLKNLLQHHSSKASIPRQSAFFMVQLLHLYMTTGKTIALSIWSFVLSPVRNLVVVVSWFSSGRSAYSIILSVLHINSMYFVKQQIKKIFTIFFFVLFISNTVVTCMDWKGLPDLMPSCMCVGSPNPTSN